MRIGVEGFKGLIDAFCDRHFIAHARDLGLNDTTETFVVLNHHDPRNTHGSDPL